MSQRPSISRHSINPTNRRNSFGEIARAVILPWVLAPAASAILDVKHANALNLQDFTDSCELDSCIFRDRREFQRAGRKIVITQEFDKNGSKSTGSAVWEGDVVLTKFMAQDLPRDYWRGKNVLELGAGTGLAGMVASILGAERVAITDGDERVLELARRNIAANLRPAEQAAVDVTQLRWESAADPAWKFNGGQRVDVILAADVTYYRDYIPPLINTMLRLCGPNTEVLLAHTKRPTDGSSMEQFARYFEAETITTGPALTGHPDTFLLRMRARPDAPKVALGEGGCNPGYTRNAALNLCVPDGPAQ